MQQNFWEQGNLMKVNFREHLNLFLGNKGKTPIFSREQGNMYPPPPPGRPSCVMFFSPSRAVLSAILRDEYLTSADITS